MTEPKFRKVGGLRKPQGWFTRSSDHGLLNGAVGPIPCPQPPPRVCVFQELQPDAVGFQGPGENVIRWCGTESGHVGEPFWSSAQSSLAAGGGGFDGAVFSPGEADTCFQGGCGADSPPPAQWDDLPGPYGGCWFYNEGSCPKSLSSLVSTCMDLDTVTASRMWAHTRLP